MLKTAPVGTLLATTATAVLTLFSCTQNPRPVTPSAPAPIEATPAVVPARTAASSGASTAPALWSSGEWLYLALCTEQSGTVERLRFDGSGREEVRRDLPCPVTSAVALGQAPVIPDGGVLLDRHAGTDVVERRGSIFLVTDGVSHEVSAARSLRMIRSRAARVYGIRAGEDGEKVVAFDAEGREVFTTTPFQQIESYDIAPDGGEVVVSALRGSGLDIAVSSGTVVKWIGTESVEERGVTWAPRGSKVSFFVDTPSGTLLRTIHLPTAAQLTVDLGPSMPGPMVWDAVAERVAFWLQSPMFSPRLVSVRYGGEDQRTIVASARTSELDLDFVDPSTWVVAPRAVRYNERHPTVVWSDPLIFRWSGARADAWAAGAGLIVTNRELRNDDATFWEMAVALPWVDESAIFAIGPGEPLAPRAAVRIWKTGTAYSLRSGSSTGTVAIGADPDGSLSALLVKELALRNAAGK